MAKKMKKDECDCEDECSCGCSSGKWHSHAKCGGIYGLGFLKALVWPAFLVYELLKSVCA